MKKVNLLGITIVLVVTLFSLYFYFFLRQRTNCGLVPNNDETSSQYIVAACTVYQCEKWWSYIPRPSQFTFGVYKCSDGSVAKSVKSYTK